MIALTAFISPLHKDRERIRRLIGDTDFIESYRRCSLEVCEQRDTTGLHRRARAGEADNFTGISSPYEAPEHPQLLLDTGTEPPDVCAEKVLAVLRERGVIATTEPVSI